MRRQKDNLFGGAIVPVPLILCWVTVCIITYCCDRNKRFLSLFANFEVSGRCKDGKTRVKSKIRSTRADLQFPMGHMHRLLRKGNYAEWVSAGAPVSLAAVLMYLAAEVLELSATAARATRRPVSLPVTCNWPSATTRS
ncbi:hypothetical protein PHET_02145 [Paragonimus heterotremus]|uniref:Histone H2A n=1 Tax=Paragonimus heterotremus TaxID=100268 RepID=A0A8J4TLW9_9TREM|nr:hypothetical protein PHET_02145 [Paragonimus heterotremus]